MKMRLRVILIGLFLTVLFAAVGIFILLNSFLSKKTTPAPRQANSAKGAVTAAGEIKVSLPSRYIRFSIPADFKSSLSPSGSYIDNEVVLKEGSDDQTKGIRVTYSMTSPWTPNIDNIPFGDAFNGAGKTVQLDSTSLLQDGSSLTPNQVTMFTYLSGDAEGHGRGLYGSVHQGDVRLDFKTPDHVVMSEAVFFQCIDSTTKAAISDRCAKILHLFLSTLKTESATPLVSPPSLESIDYFGSLVYRKRYFDSDENVALPSLNNPITFPYFSMNQDVEIFTTDDNLRVMRCMPTQLYSGQAGYPYYSHQQQSVPIYTYRTTDGNNLFHEVLIQDPHLQSLAQHIQEYAATHGRELTQFIACQTDDGRYIIKYNGKKIIPSESADSVDNAKENFIDAEVGVMTPDGAMQGTASIPLPLTQIYCERPLELTKDNIFYFGCDVTEPNPYGMKKGQNIYRVDLNTLQYKLMSQCRVTYTYPQPGTNSSSITEPMCN